MPSKSVLPYIGCLVTVVAIATSPMIQQILQFETRQTQIPDAFASVRTSQVYDNGEQSDVTSDGTVFRMSNVLVCYAVFNSY